MPMASAPRPVRVRAIAGTEQPVKVRPFSSKVMVQRTGRLVFSLAASRAARVSPRSVIVSMAIRSAPAASPARTTRTKAL